MSRNTKKGKSNQAATFISKLYDMVDVFLILSLGLESQTDNRLDILRRFIRHQKHHQIYLGYFAHLLQT